MTTPTNLLAAAAEYAVAEARVIQFEGNRASVEYEALTLVWQSATVGLGKAARLAGKAALADLGATVTVFAAFVAAVMAEPEQPAVEGVAA